MNRRCRLLIPFMLLAFWVPVACNTTSKIGQLCSVGKDCPNSSCYKQTCTALCSTVCAAGLVCVRPDGADTCVKGDEVSLPPKQAGGQCQNGTLQWSKSGSLGALTVGQPLTLDTYTDKAQNTDALSRNGQIVAAARGDCGAVGILLRVRNGTTTELHYVEIGGANTPEVVEPKDNGSSASLFFDSDCSPLVLRGSTQSGYLEYTRSASKEWTSATVADLATVLGSAPTSLEQMGSDTANGKHYLFAHVTIDGKPRLLKGERAATADAKWTFTDLPRPVATQFSGYKVDPSGGLHVLFRNTEYPCDPCNVDFLHGTLADGASDWTREIVQKGKWGSPDDEFIESGSLDFDASGNAYIAAHFTRRAKTGSYKIAELRIYGKGTDSWCSETIATKNDGFTGKDGDNFTGAEPQLVIDGAGQLHVTFLDQAVWHDSKNQQNEIRGNPRYAARTPNGWTMTTLLKQSGQTESSNPLLGFSNALLLVSPDGTGVALAGVVFSWETASIYNDDQVTSTHAAQVITATAK